MAKGQRGKGGQSTATTAANGPTNNRTTKAGNDREDHQNSQQSVKGGQRNQRGGTNRGQNKKEIIHNEEPKADIVEDSPNSNHVNATEKKDAQHSSSIHPKVQPTTEQLMIAKIIDHSDDPHQRKKIQQVMDVTGKPEDEVATALFDAGWDESRAVELLLEDGDHLSAWEETGKKKKTKKSGQSNDKEEWDDDEGFHEGRDKSRGSKGPPRMRRGGGGSNARGGSSGGGLGGSSRDFTGENGNSEQVGGREGGLSMGGGSRGGASRRGDQPPRRGGGRGGGTRNFSSRQQSGQTHHSDRGHGLSSSNTGGFQGSIDTWNNPGDTGNGNSSSSAAGDRGHGSGDHRGGRSGRGRGGGGRGGGSGKDAFDNAGNWGDDFPQADDWDNEEYTGSLKDTKIFTSSQAGGQGGGGRAKQKTPPSNQPQQQQQQPPVQQPTQQPPVGANSQRGGQGVAPGSSSSFSASLTNGPTSSYSQSIDLSTLLQKPTTQSSVGSAAAAPGAQFNQQAATETLKSSLGIGQSSSGPKEPMYSYAQASAFTSINKQQGSSRGGPVGGGVPTSVQPQPNKPATQVVGGRGASNRGIAPSSSAKIPAVEMPGDSLGRLDVSFGGLDLQFGGSASANSESGMTSGSGGFEFGTSEDKSSATSNIKPTSTGDVTSFAPSAKEVNKSLSNALTGGTGKLNAVSVQAATAVHTTQQQDSFSKTASAVSTVSSSANSANQPQAVGPTSGGSSGNYGGVSGGSSNNKPTQDLSGYNYNYKGYNNYQQYQYPTAASNNYSSSAAQQQQQQSAGSGSQYKGGGQYDKYSQDASAQLQNNPAAAVLGLASTSTTNALSGKVSATTASKVNMPNLPPGVASMLHHPQYMATGLAPAAFYGLQQPMYGAYGQTAGFDDIAALQRATASAAGLHTLPTTGFYDPNNQFAAATSLGVAANNRDGSAANLNSLTGTGSNTSSSAIGGSSGSSAQPSAFTSTTTAANVSTTSPGPNAITTSASTGSGSQHAHHVQQQQQQHPQQQQQTAFNLATNALAAQQMPPGYAYFYGNMAGAALPAAYGAATANPSHVYQPTAAMTVPGATTTSQFQKTYGQQNNYGTGGYDNMSQQQYKQDSNSYSSNGQSKSSGGSAGAGSGKGHQYWGNTLTSAPLW